MAFDGARLKEAREAMREHGRKISQERFAELIGVSRRSPGRWENGEVEPRMEHLSRIADVTGKPIAYFVSSEGEAERPRRAEGGTGIDLALADH